MKDVTTGIPSLRASSATGTSSPEAPYFHAQHHHGRLCTRNALENFVDTVADDFHGYGGRRQGH